MKRLVVVLRWGMVILLVWGVIFAGVATWQDLTGQNNETVGNVMATAFIFSLLFQVLQSFLTRRLDE